MKTNAEYHNILARKLQWARNAAEYCRVQATLSRDRAASAIYADIADKAEAEADKIYQLSQYYFNRYWNETYGDASGQEIWEDFIHRRGKFAAADA